jgi:preprotein translocase subunit SecE
LAAKDKTPATKKASGPTTVTRIKATDSAAAQKDTSKKTAPTERSTEQHGAKRLGTPFIATGNYFRGAWYELRQVRWPNRKATWSLTAAVLGFTAFFVVLILLLDALFKYLFQLILG